MQRWQRRPGWFAANANNSPVTFLQFPAPPWDPPRCNLFWRIPETREINENVNLHFDARLHWYWAPKTSILLTSSTECSIYLVEPLNLSAFYVRLLTRSRCFSSFGGCHARHFGRLEFLFNTRTTERSTRLTRDPCKNDNSRLFSVPPSIRFLIRAKLFTFKIILNITCF